MTHPPTIPTSVHLERRSSALYAARTRTMKGTQLSSGAVDELCEAFLELHSAHNEQGAELERVVAELEKQRLENVRLRRAGPKDVEP